MEGNPAWRNEGEAGRLRAGSIGPLGLAALAIGITSPAMGLYGQWGPMQVAAGPITPLIYVAALFVTLPTAISYARLNRHFPSAGAASTWLWIAAGPSLGFLTGLAMAAYFAFATIAQPLIFALFFRDLLVLAGAALPDMAAMTAGILISIGIIGWVALRGAETSIRATVMLMIAETFVVVALTLTILGRRWGELSLAPLDPANAAHGLAGFWSAMILGVLGFCGFDVVSTAAEETHAPGRHVPAAILITVIGITVFWALNALVLTHAVPPQTVARLAAQGLTPVTPIAAAYWGGGSLIVVLTALTGILAVLISCVHGTSRIVFALARHGLLPSALGQLSGERRVPRVAMATLLLLATMLCIATLFLVGNGLASFVWWANGLVFFATLTFLAVNLACLFYLRRFPAGDPWWMRGPVIPLLGVAANLYLLYAAFFQSLWSAGGALGRSVVVTCIALLAVQAGAVLLLRRTRPGLFVTAPMMGEA